MASQRPWQVPGGSARPEAADIARLGRRLLRKVVSTARAEDAPGPINAGGSGPLTVTGADLDTALATLQGGTNQLTRLLLGARAHDETDPVTGWLAESQGRADSDGDSGWFAYIPLQQ